MKFTIEQTEPTVIAIHGDVLGGADAMEFTGAIGELIRKGVHHVVVDLSDVRLMNSSGLGMLVGASASLRSAKGTLAVAGANAKIRELFTMTRLDSVLAQYETRSEALAAHR